MWRLVPQRGKVPLIKDWQNAASDDRRQLENWGKVFPGCDWGLVTGRASGVVVLDCDVKTPSGAASTRRLLEVWLPDLKTLVVQTPSGGLHIYFKHPGFDVHGHTPLHLLDYAVGSDRHCGQEWMQGIELMGDTGKTKVTIPPTAGYKVVMDEPITDLPVCLSAGLYKRKRQSREWDGEKTEFTLAVEAYCFDNPEDYPTTPGTCPMCEHNDCFTALDGSDDRWICFSSMHGSTECGRESSNGYWTGTALDIHLYQELGVYATKDMARRLREEGYLANRVNKEVNDNE